MSLTMHLFATHDDISAVLEHAESKHSLAYTAAGVLDTSTPNSFISWRELPNLGRSIFGVSIQETAYIVTFRCRQLSTQEIKRRDGKTVFAIDQSTVPQSITIRPGGTYENNMIIAGEISTISESQDSLKLWSTFSGIIRRDFTKIKTFYVGSQALSLFENGTRLVSNKGQSTVYDLSRH